MPRLTRLCRHLDIRNVGTYLVSVEFPSGHEKPVQWLRERYQTYPEAQMRSTWRHHRRECVALRGYCVSPLGYPARSWAVCPSLRVRTVTRRRRALRIRSGQWHRTPYPPIVESFEAGYPSTLPTSQAHRQGNPPTVSEVLVFFQHSEGISLGHHRIARLSPDPQC